MPINKFGLSFGGGSESHYQWRGLLRNYVHDNAFCMVATDFDANSRLALPVLSQQTMRAAQYSRFESSSEIERKITALQNNVQVC